MRSLIAMAALLASVSAFAGELDGKAIVCDWGEDPNDSWPSKFGFAFNESEVFQHSVSFRHLDPEVVTRVSKPSAYDEGVSGIRWRWGNYSSWSLDRRSLLLRETVLNDGENLEYACEALPSWEALNEIMESVRAEEQSKNDEEMKDKKI